MATFFEQAGSDYFPQLVAEAVEHAGRHGFEPSEDYDGYAYIGDNAHRDAVFRVLSHVEGRVRVEVVGMGGSVSWQEIDARDFMGGVHPDAAFMDVLEESLVDAKRRCSC